MKINSVKFKNENSFNKNKTKINVLEVHEPFGIIIFQDEEDVDIDTTKVSQSSELSTDLSQIPSGLAIVIANDFKTSKEYFIKNKIDIKQEYQTTNTFIVDIPDFMSFEDFKNELLINKVAISVEQDFITKEIKDAVNDFYSISSQWHLDNIKAELAWAQIPANAIGDVAVLDCSCETTHEDLGLSAFNANWNCVTNNSNVEPINDNAKHGTPCSGIICARTNNNLGVSSIGFNKLRVQFLNIGYNETSSGGFATSDAICTMAINKAMENPTCLAISMSWGGGGAKPAFEAALNAARTQGRNGKGIPIFASAGNSGLNGFTQLPAAYNSVMAIGASTSANTKATFSNYGPKLFAAAPGTSIRTTDRSGAKGYTSSASLDPRIENYTSFSGTSASCPLFAGVAAAVLLKNPNLTEVQLRELLKQACRKIGGYTYNTSGWSNELGFGIIDYNKAMSLAESPVINPTEYHDLTVLTTIPSTITNNQPLPINITVNTDKPNLESKTVQCQIYFTANLANLGTPIFTDTVTIGGGIQSESKNFNYTLPASTTGTRYIITKVDTLNTTQETNEENNTSQSTINITLPVGDPNCDLSVTINRYEWLDPTICRVWYTFKNEGSVVINNYKARVGFKNLPSFNTTWTNTTPLNPGSTRSGATAQRNFPSTFPADFTITITEVNGAQDINLTNNVSTIIINRV